MASEGEFSYDQMENILAKVDPLFYQDIVEERSGNYDFS